ncbi:MAG: FAD:protein FMN transferase [Candidatus Latescibacteria bacterium]|nr:FAD:protein FMN transferase [Candidatus Latescibacterota bacterium]
MRKHRDFIIILFLFFQILNMNCAKLQSVNYEYNDFIYGSYLRLVISASDSLQAQNAINKVMQVLHQIDTVASSFNPHSEVSQLNKKGAALMSSDLKALITQAMQISENTDGAFDITVGSAMQSFYNRQEPDLSSIIDYRKINIKDDSIFLPPNMLIDIGGLAVGYALDKASALLTSIGIKTALIDAGGDIICFGNKFYTIGIKNPKGKGIIQTIKIKNQAISTSGNYEKYFEKDDQKYTHIINPKTSHPITATPDGLTSVTIIADKCVDADAYATAVFVLGTEHGQTLINKLKLQGVLITDDGQIIETK